MALVEYRKEGKIAIFTLNRPKVLNAQNNQFHEELNNAFLDFRDDPDLWVGIVNGNGRAFSVGADITGFLPGPLGRQKRFQRIRAEEIWKPFIAAIHGYCLGGGLQLAMECDLRIADVNARFGYPEILIGFFPGSECTLRLPRHIARSHVMELMLMGQQIDAQEAYRMGLVNKVVPGDRLMPTAIEWAETICKAGPLGVRATKELVVRGYLLTKEEGIKLEAELIEKVMSSEDFQEGVEAFIQKRKPSFKAK